VEGRIMEERLPERLAYHAAGYGVAFRAWGADFQGVVIGADDMPRLLPKSKPCTAMELFGYGMTFLAGVEAEAFAFDGLVHGELQKYSHSMAHWQARVFPQGLVQADSDILDILDVFDAMHGIARALVHRYCKAIAIAADILQNEPKCLTPEDIDALLAEEPGGEGEDEPEDEEEG